MPSHIDPRRRPILFAAALFAVYALVVAGVSVRSSLQLTFSRGRVGTAQATVGAFIWVWFVLLAVGALRAGPQEGRERSWRVYSGTFLAQALLLLFLLPFVLGTSERGGRAAEGGFVAYALLNLLVAPALVSIAGRHVQRSRVGVLAQFAPLLLLCWLIGSGAGFMT